MRNKPETVEQWREVNKHRLINCRWCGSILPESCKSYQARAERRVIHFSGDTNPLVRVNADYIKCFDPFPCENLISEKDLSGLRSRRSSADQAFIEHRQGAGRAKELDFLTNPDHMLMEDNRRRSLLKQ